MEKFSWGIVGTGYICDKFCRALTEESDNARVAAVCSRSAESGTQFAQRFGCDKVYTDVQQMCEEGGVDIVYIGTPHPMHAEAALAAISAGKHVLCEKPMALNEKQARRIFDAAAQAGVFVMEAMWTRFLPAVQKAVEWINSGMIGQVKSVVSDYHIDREENAQSRLFDPALGGGSLLDVGVYPLYAANLFMQGTPEIVHTHMTPADTGVDKIMSATLAYENGEAHISSGFDRPSCSALIQGTEGFVLVPDWCFAHSAYLYKNGEIADSFVQIRINGMQHEAEHVMDCIRRGLTESPDHPAAMTLRELAVCDKLRAQWGLEYPNEHNEKPTVRKAAAPIVTGSKNEWNSATDWYRDATFYHIYPIGMCGAPLENDFSSQPESRLSIVADCVEHIASCGYNAVYFGPLFESTRHGYDTADYRTVDRRLGTNDDFANICASLHSRGIRVIVDGVFNHVGRDFWAFRDVREHRGDSRYTDWFHINRGGNSNYNDGFYYEGWEGHYDLVKLNLRNHEVREHLFESIRGWINEFDIDGLRLDVAYCLDHDFLRELRSFCKGIKPDFFLLGECVHGDYSSLVNESMLDSVTNYECYKGIYSSINSGNMHEIGYSLHRQFGSEHWCIYRGMSLYTFVDNHDVSRIASILADRELLPLAYSLAYSMPGIPSVYYGSELGMTGDKSAGDNALRPRLTYDDVLSMRGALSDHIARLNDARKQSKALRRGDYNQLYVRPNQLIFARSYEDERIICALNAENQPHTAHFDAGAGRAYDLITGQVIDFGGGLVIPPRTAFIGKVY